MNLTIILNAILSVCGGISIIGGAAAIIWKWLKPAVHIKDRVAVLERKADNDYKDIKDIKKMQSAMCRALVDIMDHQIYGNHTEKMEQDKKELLELITEN